MNFDTYNYCLGSHFISALEYGDEDSAAFAADSMAERAAEAEREYQAAQEEESEDYF